MKVTDDPSDSGRGSREERSPFKLRARELISSASSLLRRGVLVPVSRLRRSIGSSREDTQPLGGEHSQLGLAAETFEKFSSKERVIDQKPHMPETGPADRSTGNSVLTQLPFPRAFPTDSGESLAIPYEQYHKEFNQLSNQDNFDGFRFEWQKNVTQQMQTCHTLMLGSAVAGQLYQFGPTVVFDEGKSCMVARIGNDGTMNLRTIKRITDSLEGRVSATSSLGEAQRNTLDSALEYTAQTWAGSIKAAWQGTWILNSAFSQVLSPRLHMGGDLTLIPKNGATIGSVGARVQINPDYVFSASILRQPSFKSSTSLAQSVHGLRAQFFRKVSERLNMATELEVMEQAENGRPSSAFRLGYEYLFRQTRLQGLLDSCGRVSMFTQDTSGFGLSGVIDYWRNEYRFGFMLNMMPPPYPNDTETTKNFGEK